MIDSIIAQYAHHLSYLAVASVVTFAGSLICLPVIVARLPVNCFEYEQLIPKRSHAAPPLIHLPLLFLRNILGIILLISGIAMLFLPGQGIITIILGLSLLSFPCKQQLIYRLTRRPAVQTGMDWLRRKTGKDPFIW